MPTLTNSLLNLTSLFGTLSELGPVKKHLFRASREILLAVNSLLGFADQYVSGFSAHSGQNERQEMVRAAIRYARKSVRSIARQLPRGDAEEYRTLHRKVMSSILDVLEGEILKNSKLTTAKAKMKVEVFQAIRNVLLKEMDEEEIRSDEDNDHAE